MAIAFTTLLLTALLRAYQAGARASRRASNQRTVAPEELLHLTQVSRERARVESSSTRLSSERIYHDYNIGGSQKAFVRSCRRFPSSVLLQAERLFSTQAHRDDIRNRASYFLHLANQVNAEHHRKQARHRHETEQAERIRLHDQHVVAERAQWHADPIAWLRDTLELLALSWTGTELLAHGRGVRSCLHHACIRLFQVHGTMAADIIAGLWRSFEHTHLSDIGPSGLSAVKAVLQLHLQGIPKPEPTPSRAANFVATILPSGPTTRPPPSSRPC